MSIKFGQLAVFKNNPEYQIADGIVKTIKQDDIVGRNKRYSDLYNKISKYYTLVQRFYNWIYVKKNEKFKDQRSFLSDLVLKSGDKILEVSVGSGDNLELIPNFIEFYGLDISTGMLKACQNKIYKYNFPITLAWGMAENLPYQDNSFDAVFHVGGINFFNDKKKAINEMIRVAKPGAKIIISDETEELAKAGEKMFLAKAFFKNRDEVIVPPVDLIPKEIKDVKLSFLHNNSLYLITFTKP